MAAIAGMALVASAGAGCGGGFRAPVCPEGTTSLPPGVGGRYRMTSVTQDPRFSGAFTGLTDVEFEIGETPDAYTFHASTGSLRHVLHARSLLRDAGRDGDETMPARIPLTACEIEGVFYTQGIDDASGAYTLARLDVSPTGITTTDLLFEPAELKDAGFTTIFHPSLDWYDAGDRKWQFTGSYMLIDNRDLSAADRVRLVKLAHPTAGGTVFSKVDPEAGRLRRRADDVTLTLPRTVAR
jgi:hypothetical protein